MARFKVGDVVQLKSGGPKMTVEEEPSGTGDYYECQWFAGGKLNRGLFPRESLEKVDDEKRKAGQ